jgi:hypothetical protein
MTSLACPRQVFTERLPLVAEPYARRTSRLSKIVAHLGIALGGEAVRQAAGSRHNTASRRVPTYRPWRRAADGGARRGSSAGSAQAAGASVESAARHPHANAVRRAREQLSAGHRKAPRAGPSDIETAVPRVRRHVSGRRQSSHSAIRPHLRPRRLAVVRHRLCLRTVSQTCRPAFLSIPVALMFVAGRPTHFQGSLIP